MAYLHPRDIQTKNNIERLLSDMPFFVRDFNIYKERKQGSPYSMQKYLYTFRHFFTWLIDEKIIKAETMATIKPSDLENIPLSDIELYLDSVRESEYKSKNVVKQRDIKTVANVISSLKSLFNFLSEKSEVSETQKTLIERDVFAKVPIPIKKETAQHRAEKFSEYLIDGEDFLKFLDYIEFDFIEDLESRQKQAAFKRNMRRDLSIVTTLLTTGIRVSECANILTDDINFKKRTIKITRKGNKEDTIYLAETAFEKLTDYMETRNNDFKGAESCPYLYVTSYRGISKQITVRAIEDLVTKYTAAFSGDKGISPHKLRHSFATDFVTRGGDITDLRDILGHTTIEATSLYLNRSNERKFNFLKHLDSSRRNQYVEKNNE